MSTPNTATASPAAAPAETEEQKAERTAKEKAAQQQSGGGLGDLMMTFFAILIKMIMGSFTDPDSEYSEIDKENAAPPTTSRGAAAGKAFLDSTMREKLKALAAKYTELPANISPFVGDARITSGLGHRDAPVAGASHDHEGIDMVPNGTSKEAITVRNTMPGVVVRSETQYDKNGKVAGFGNWVEVACIDGTRRRYAHLAQKGVPVGTVLDQGAEIGVMGNTGTSSGAHLHYEWRNENGITLEPKINGKNYARNDRSYKGSGVEGSGTAAPVTPAVPQSQQAPQTQPTPVTPPSADVAAQVASLGLTDKLKVADAALGNLPSMAMKAFSTAIGVAPSKG